MSLLGHLRADQQINQLIEESDPASSRALGLVERLKKTGPKAIPKLIDALALSDKSHTMVLVDVLGALVNDKNLDMYREGLADGNERVVSGTAWALSGSTNYDANALLEFFDDEEVSKGALIEVLRVHKQDLSVHELMQRAYDLDNKDKAAVFLARNRKFAVLVAFLTGAVLTPPDVFSQTALALPFIVLYEVGIWVARFFGKKPETEAEAAGDESAGSDAAD